MTLRDDFEKFSKRHSWYKHNKLYGRDFYVFQKDGIHWDFQGCNNPPPETPYFVVRFGPFLQGVYSDTSQARYHGNRPFVGGFNILYEDNKDIFRTWIYEFYPQWSDVDWDSIYNDSSNLIVLDLFRKEYDKYWKELCLKWLNSSLYIT